MHRVVSRCSFARKFSITRVIAENNIPGRVPRNSLQKTGGEEHIPPAPIHRVTYEYPPPPEPDRKPPQSSPWKRHVPLLIGIGGLVWAVYAFNYVFGNGAASDQTVLNPTKFSPFRITGRIEVGTDLVLIEVSPKYAAQMELKRSGGRLWNGKRLWSVQVKHPDLQIARKYTPLPLYMMHSSASREPLLRMMGDAEEEGRLCLLVRRYADGEMSRYIWDLPIGSDIELRGPFVEHKFGYTAADMAPPRAPMVDVPSRLAADDESGKPAELPENTAFFAAGTGVAPALQMLLSRNPPHGYTEVWLSVRRRIDIPFDKFLLFLERVGRAKFHIFVDEEGKYITLADIPAPTSTENQSTKQVDKGRKYSSALQQFQDPNRPWPYANGVQKAIVCGPPGYVRYVAGEPGMDGTRPIEGLLGSRGWTIENTTRMNDL